jgi:hypothetical protein
MTRDLRDKKSFRKSLGIQELSNRMDDATDQQDVSGAAGAFFGRRRRRSRSMHPTDFLLYEDNSLYALPYIEPLTDRGIKPMRVQLFTDSTSGLTPIAASSDKRQCPTCGALHSDPDSAFCCQECRSDAKQAARQGAKTSGARVRGGSGYTPCACGGCEDIVVSNDESKPDFCWACEDAGCKRGNFDCLKVNDDEDEGWIDASASPTESKAKQFMLNNADQYGTATELAEAAALEFDLYEQDEDFTIPEWVFEMAADVKPTE